MGAVVVMDMGVGVGAGVRVGVVGYGCEYGSGCGMVNNDGGGTCAVRMWEEVVMI